MYFNNLDYPGNNNVLWRPRAEGGKWRWIAKDLDYTMGLYGGNAGSSGGYDHRIIDQWYNPDDSNLHGGANFSITWDATRMFRRQMEDPDFNREFIDRFCVYMGDFLNSARIREIWDPMYELMKPEWKMHQETIYNPWWPNIDDETGKIRTWLLKRNDEMYKQLGNTFSIGSPIKFTITTDASSDDEADVTVNGVPLTRNTFDGKFFANRTLILEATAPEGKVVSGWKVKTTQSNNSVNTTEVDGARYEFTMPTCKSLAINPILGDATGISNVDEDNWIWKKSGKQLTLTGVPAGTKIQVFDLRGMSIYNAVSDGSTVTITLPTNQLHVLKVGAKTVKL